MRQQPYASRLETSDEFPRVTFFIALESKLGLLPEKPKLTWTRR
jgi:hypothetical protein